MSEQPDAKKQDVRYTAEEWKQWVRFVLADAPSPSPDTPDDELRRIICAQWDKIQKQATANAWVITQLRAEFLCLSKSDGGSFVRADGACWLREIDGLILESQAQSDEGRFERGC